MRKKTEKRSMSVRKKISIFLLSFFFLVLIIVTFFGRKGWLETYQTQKEYSALLQEKERLKIEKTKLLRDIEEMKTNPKAIEKKAREKLWLMKPDEIVIIKEKK